MLALRLVPVVLGSLVLGAHVLRAGHVPLAVALALVPLLLLARRAWAVRTVQLVLLVGAVEWIRTLSVLVGARRALGMPSTRMAVILVAVALVTAAGALLLQPLAARWGRRVETVPAEAS